MFSFSKSKDISVQKLLTAPTLGQNFHLPLSVHSRGELEDLQTACLRWSWLRLGMSGNVFGVLRVLSPASSTFIACMMARQTKPSTGSGSLSALTNGRFLPGCFWQIA